MTSPETEKEILSELICLKAMVARLDTKLEERQPMLLSHESEIAKNSDRISECEKKLSGFKAWLAAASMVGGIITWVGSNITDAIFRKG